MYDLCVVFVEFEKLLYLFTVGDLRLVGLFFTELALEPIGQEKSADQAFLNTGGVEDQPLRVEVLAEVGGSGFSATSVETNRPILLCLRWPC